MGGSSWLLSSWFIGVFVFLIQTFLYLAGSSVGFFYQNTSLPTQSMMWFSMSHSTEVLISKRYMQTESVICVNCCSERRPPPSESVHRPRGPRPGGWAHVGNKWHVPQDCRQVQWMVRLGLRHCIPYPFSQDKHTVTDGFTVYYLYKTTTKSGCQLFSSWTAW